MPRFARVVLALASLSCSCAGPGGGDGAAANSFAPARVAEPALRLPQVGDDSVDVRVFYGVPLLQKSFFWDGNGEIDVAGLQVRRMWQVDEDWALGVGATGANWFFGGADVQSLEVEGVARRMLYRSEGDTCGVFVEGGGGYQQARSAIPPEGTEWNFTFHFGTGVQVPVGEAVDLMTGLSYHHISNALGRDNPRNPSQNDVRLWIGLSFRF